MPHIGALFFARSFVPKLAISNGTPQVQWTSLLNCRALLYAVCLSDIKEKGLNP
jgi:hypothetical protein